MRKKNICSSFFIFYPRSLLGYIQKCFWIDKKYFSQGKNYDFKEDFFINIPNDSV